MTPALKRVLRNVAGVLFLILGLLGLVLPFLQGILFLMIGLALIDLPIKHRAHQWLRARSKWYRAIAVKYMEFKRRWRQRRELKRAAKQGAPPATR
jgi:uncharacterized membrane protein YbaN (DUF454 family)